MTHAKLRQAAEAATPGPWDRMPGRGLVRAIRDDLAVPLFEPLEPYSDPLLDAPTCRVGGEVVFRANSQAARESAAIRQGVHNAAFIALANPAAVLDLLDEIAKLRAEHEADMDLVAEVGENLQSQRNTITRLEAELSAARARGDDMAKALRSLAEGNLGDAPWQANYETIKLVARNAIPTAITGGE